MSDERAVLGDELQQRGEPHGELIGLSLALAAMPAEASPARRRLVERRIEAVLGEHHDALYGELAPHVTAVARPDLYDPAAQVTRWDGGFADAIWLQARRGDAFTLEAAYRAMRPLSIARFVRDLALGTGDYPATLAAIVDDPPPTLRELVFGDLRRRLIGLRSVLLADTAMFGRLPPTLEVLRVYSAVAFAPFAAPRLRELTVHAKPGSAQFGGELPALASVVLSDFDVPHLVERYPLLRDITVSGGTLASGWLERALASPRIHELSLSLHGCLTDADLDTFVRLADRVELARKVLVGRWQFTRTAFADRPQLPPSLIVV